ncbi:hypothetical protein PVK06_001244 [Gossypium arboreum]|uniref:Uncharacterized protein n=1 Tax=Gossypium arboreum TaxID=29729 RepID=A0ABR0R1K0_GOSAR|nr:hypothetical protein PVK06_001244 [Gossypium arboreum]
MEENIEVSIENRYVAISAFNLPSYSKVGTIVDIRGLSDGERLLQCSKGICLLDLKPRLKNEKFGIFAPPAIVDGGAVTGDRQPVRR